MENRKESTILHMENRNIKGSKWATFLISILSPVAFFPFLFTKDITNGRYIWTRHGGIFGSGFDLGKVFYMEIPVATLATTISINLVIYFKASTGARGGLSQENVRKFFLVKHLRSSAISLSILMYLILWMTIVLFGIRNDDMIIIFYSIIFYIFSIFLSLSCPYPRDLNEAMEVVERGEIGSNLLEAVQDINSKNSLWKKLSNIFRTFCNQSCFLWFKYIRFPLAGLSIYQLIKK